MRVTCEACAGCGWVLERGAEWGRECRVCGGRGRVSEYRIARLGASIDAERGPEVESRQWTKRALRDLRRGRGLGARRGLRLVALLASLARLRP